MSAGGSYGEIAAMAFNNLGGDGKPEAGSFDVLVFMFLQAIKTFGQALQRFGRDGNAGI